MYGIGRQSLVFCYVAWIHWTTLSGNNEDASSVRHRASACGVGDGGNGGQPGRFAAFCGGDIAMLKKGRLFLTIIVLFAVACSADPYPLVRRDYNFSIRFPENPTAKTTVNDEGGTTMEWTVVRKHLNYADYYDVRASCYSEVLNTDDELTSNDALLAMNGISVLESRRFVVTARETGREVPALARTTKSVDSSEVISNIHAVDGHCLITVGTRINPGTAGESAQFLASFQFLK